MIGNPPYIEYSKIRTTYKLLNYKCESAGNLYAFVLERSIDIINNIGNYGFIVPISFVCTQRTESIQNKIIKNFAFNYFSTYGERPSKLFVGAEVLLTIILSNGSKVNGKSLIYATGFNKWSSLERNLLFQKLCYTKVEKVKSYVIPKISSDYEISILNKMANNSKLEFALREKNNNKIFYRIGGGRYWKIFTNFQPNFVLNGKESISSRENYLYLDTTKERDATIGLLSSSFFYWYFIMTTNCRDLNPIDLKECPLNPNLFNNKLLMQLCYKVDELMNDYKIKSINKEKKSKLTGNIIDQEFYPRKSKKIIDDIDYLLGKCCGFSKDETDYIINYDIKFRCGSEDD